MRVLIAHPDLQAGGGAEVYARALVRVLRQRGHAVGLCDISGHLPAKGGHYTPVWFRLGQYPGLRRLTLWKYALICRALPKLSRQYDYVVLSFGEGPKLFCPVLTVLHGPLLFDPSAKSLRFLGAKFPYLRGFYTRFCKVLAGACVGIGVGPRNPVVANSRWTAHLVQQCGAKQPSLLYPPVQPLCQFPLRSDTPLAQPAIFTRGPQSVRDPYLIVVVGRIVRNKRLEDAVMLLERLRRYGIPAHLKIIGHARCAYAGRFLRRYASHPHISLLPNADQAALAEVLSRARIGLHMYRGEHFGIAVAEMICAGVLPFVHDSGGVCELVTDPSLKFVTTTDLLHKVIAVMSWKDAICTQRLAVLKTTPALQKALRFPSECERLLQSVGL